MTTDAFPSDSNRNYATPAGNAFAEGGAPEMWAMGLRNPFRGSVDPVTRDVFVGDVGQDAIEEIDRILQMPLASSTMAGTGGKAPNPTMGARTIPRCCDLQGLHISAISFRAIFG